ncbi:hypothetical protein LEP1GSC137_1127 [Leptospira borgpetersenii str. Noumea 25]|uniref:Uncharacterized protein n=1 Tax=Leptospira borgpetersenii str. 200701203 TaxID=1193007 RepID=M3GAP3_LEPBO|nr:hypothetical protein LEP1GSC123_1809 [Leptospira borgpetersenii str. 200701203]EMO08020.1 hypothetical protein LEP1GSC137_1127 [Leptospira borgpetersenii str. Noumea 25]
MRFFSKGAFDLFLETHSNAQGISYIKFTNRKIGHRIYSQKILNLIGLILFFY